jgi:hypothetical protein
MGGGVVRVKRPFILRLRRENKGPVTGMQQLQLCFEQTDPMISLERWSQDVQSTLDSRQIIVGRIVHSVDRLLVLRQNPRMVNYNFCYAFQSQA